MAKFDLYSAIRCDQTAFYDRGLFVGFFDESSICSCKKGKYYEGASLTFLSPSLSFVDYHRAFGKERPEK